MEFEVIYKIYHKAIFGYCYKFFQSCLMVDAVDRAKDISQETFIAAYKQWNGFEGKAHVQRFLYMVAANKCRNEIITTQRHEKSHKEILFLSNEAEIPEYLAINSDVISFLLEQLKKLGPRQKQVIELLFKGFNSTEIATQLGITRKTVLNVKLSAFSFLRKQQTKPEKSRMEALPTKLRNIFRMLYIESMTVQEVSKELGINIESVRDAGRDAIKRLRTK